LVFDDFSYDGKVMHIELKRGQVVFFVVISYRKNPGADLWSHELLRLRVKGSSRRPFDGTLGAAWPGPDELQGPNQPSDVLYALSEDGREQHAPDLWATQLDQLVVGVGPAPHIYLEVTHMSGARVWAVDDGGVVLVKDRRRPALHDGYRGDEQGRYTRAWLNRDKVVAVKRSSIGYVPGALWRRRNKYVLHAFWKRFRKVEDWFKGEKLFDYDLSDPHDLLKLHSFLLVSPLSDPWISTPALSEFRDRCMRAERLAYDHFRLPHARGAAPRARLEEDDESSDSDRDADADEATETEHERASLSAFPAPCTLVWGKLDGVRGKVPAAALSVTHVDDAGASTSFAPADVARIEFRPPNDGFAQVAQSSLFNTAQLSSMYSTTGSRCHLVMCFQALLRDGDANHELDTSRVLYTHALHAADERDDPKSPYESRDGRVYLRPAFHAFVFEAFYTAFVRGALDKLANRLGQLVLVEYPVYHPHLLVARGGDVPLRRPQTVLDSIYRATDGTLTLVDLKTLMEARPPHGRLLNLKNMRQVTTNALFFSLMTKLRIARVALAYVSRSQTVTFVTVDVSQCAAVTSAAAWAPLKGAAGSLRTLMNTADAYAINARLQVAAMVEAGASGDNLVAGQPLPSWLELPVAPPPSPAPTAAPQQTPAPRRAARRGTRRSPASSRSPPGSPPPAVGAPLADLFVAPDAAAAAVVAPAPAVAVPKHTGSETAAMRASINERIGEECEELFDNLKSTVKAKLRGRADELFQHLARSRALFPRERVADGTVDTMKHEALNQPARYPREFADDLLRPEVVQALIRTAQRALNVLVVHEFARTRGQRAQAEVADGVTTQAFLEKVLHHSRRDLWTTQAVEWAEERVDDVLAGVKKEFEAFLSG
jgi:hypothetical protein